MKIIVVNVDTSGSMTEVIAAGARRYASPGTQTVVLCPFFGPAAADGGGNTGDLR
jgi:allantoin racemase